MSTIAQFRTKVYLLIDDPAPSRYTANQVDQALRQALNTYDEYRPNMESYILEATGSQRLVMPADINIRWIKKVEWIREDQYQDEIGFYAYFQDTQWTIETIRTVVPSGDQVAVEYAARHYIDGLDSAAGTSVPDVDDDLLAIGAAAYAIRSRASSKLEDNNLNKDEAKMLNELANEYLRSFLAGLGTPDTVFKSSTWADRSIDSNY